MRFALALCAFLLVVTACRIASDHDIQWRGIDHHAMTCDSEVFYAKLTCVSRGTAYLCLLNRQQWLYDCAPDGTSTKAER